MKSWSNWLKLTRENIIDNVPKKEKGVYAIRITKVKNEKSDIIYIGCGKKNGRLRTRLLAIARGRNHCAASEINQFKNRGLEFSWFATSVPDGVEKALFIAFWISTGQRPKCNKSF